MFFTYALLENEMKNNSNKELYVQMCKCAKEKKKTVILVSQSKNCYE